MVNTMMRNWLIIVMLLTLSVVALAQEHTISGTITGLENKDLYLMQLLGEKRSIVDTTQTDLLGAFTFVDLSF